MDATDPAVEADPASETDADPWADTSADSDAGPVPVPRQVHCELETLRQLNTYDLRSPEVLDAFATYNFDAAREWAVEHPDEYVRAVTRGTKDASLAADEVGPDD